MSSTDSQTDVEKEVEEEIEQARSELTDMVLVKQKEVVLKMGTALEKIRKGSRRSGICEELKERLREEIARGIIAKRTIVAYCSAEWKNPVKSGSGRKGAERKHMARSAAQSAAEAAETSPEADRQDIILISTDGTVGTETGALENAELERTKHGRIRAGDATPPHMPAPTLLTFEFSISLGDVRREIVHKFSQAGDSTPLWFHGIIDQNTGKILQAGLGQLPENVEGP